MLSPKYYALSIETFSQPVPFLLHKYMYKDIYHDHRSLSLTSDLLWGYFSSSFFKVLEVLSIKYLYTSVLVEFFLLVLEV